MYRKTALVLVLGCVTPGLALAQTAPPAARSQVPARSAETEGDTEVEALVISGQRQYGAVVGDITPEETFNPADIRALGVSSVSDLLSELAAQTTSGRGGSPVVLLNGRRISGLGEIRDIPTEAIQRVEVLPEEVGLKYGYSAEQKVVNIVLRQRFRAQTVELGAGGPTAGGQSTEQLDASTLRLDKVGRTNLAVKLSHSDALLESDRDLTDQDAAADANILDNRTLSPRTSTVSVNAVRNHIFENGVSATINATADYSRSTSLLGLAKTNLVIPADSPFAQDDEDQTLVRYRDDLGALEQNSRDLSGHLGFTLDKQGDKWRWSLTGAYDHDTTRTLTDRGVDVTGLQARLDALDPTFDPFGALPAAGFNTDWARSVSDTGNLQLVVNGALARLPAGDLSTTLKIGAEGSRLDADSRRSGVAASSDLSRTSQNVQVNFDLPLTSRRNDVLPALGDLSANLNLAANHLSDVGSLTTLGYGATWSPIKPVSFIVSMTRQEDAPSMAQLGAPTVSTPDARVFDFVTGTSVDVTRVSGGNPDLKAEEKRVLKLGVTLKPSNISGLSVTANYFRTRIDDPISSFPAATSDVEDAFPDRFTRDDDGMLTRIDARAVNLARQESDQLRWGFNYSRQIGKTPPRPSFPPGQAPWERNRAQGAGQASSAPTQAQGQTQTPAQTAQASDQPPGMNLLQGLQSQGQERPAQPPSEPTAPTGDAARGGSGGSTNRGGGERGPGGPGGFGGPGGGAGAARLQLALFHTVHLREKVFLNDTAAPLDLLHGDALNSSGGQPQNEVEAQAGFTKNGFGARLTAKWRSATDVESGTGATTGPLHFSDLTTINLRVFANLAAQRELVAAHPILRGVRLSLSVNNLFDAKMDVRNANGATPNSYQPDYLDPTGRTVKLSIRKVFFSQPGGPGRP